MHGSGPDTGDRRLRARAAAWGIDTTYLDGFDARIEVPDETLRSLLAAMEVEPTAPPGEVGTPPLVVRTGGGPRRMPGAVEVVLEDGTRRVLHDELPGDLPSGYHGLQLRDRDAPHELIVSPGRCLLPDDLHDWGWSVQLPAARSAGSWGIGDLGDLARLGRWSAGLGARALLCNPIGAVTPGVTHEPSPYYPSSRRFLEPIHLDVTAVPGFAALPDGDELLARGAALNDGATIERDDVAALKLPVLERCFRLRRDDDGLDAYRAERGAELTRFATFCALAEQFGGGWHAWPHAYRDPASGAVHRFAAEHADRIAFHTWLQWQCDEQLRRAGHTIGLVGDLPIGADPDGADAWAWQHVLADGVSIGAPPDQLGPEGQDWALPAFVPWKLRAASYRPFVSVLRAAMRHVEGLRIDHVLGLFRLFWIPAGAGAARGAYVRMPARDLFDVLALESHRSSTYVIGEDLGTVPPGVREELDERDVLRYQVWWFDEEPIERWSPKALASVTTHDLPTVAGVWNGDDGRMLAELGRDPDVDWHDHLRRRLARLTGLPPTADAEDVVVALHRHLAAAPCRLVLAQLEDALAVPHRVNVPGTDRRQRPRNWSTPLPVPLEDLGGHPTAAAVATAMDTARRAATPTTGRADQRGLGGARASGSPFTP